MGGGERGENDGGLVVDRWTLSSLIITISL